MPRKCGQVAGTHWASKGLVSKVGRGDASSSAHGASSQSSLENVSGKERGAADEMFAR